MDEFKPKILGFLCNWCSYAGADLAGVSRIKYAPNIRVIRVMCSGRVDPVFIIDAFLKNIDGVMVLGCHFGDCHYLNGNYHAEKRIVGLQKLLGFAGVGQGRLYLDWVSAAEGERFAGLVNDFAKKIREIGPFGKTGDVMDALNAARDVVSGEAFRHITGIEWQVTEKENVYGEKVPKDEFQVRSEKVLHQEFVRARILRLIKNRQFSVPEIASSLGMPPDVIFNEICSLQDKGSVSLSEIKDDHPRYTAIQ